jgi:tripartite-type tricarboxylate transporter receptor subunit TctC
MIKLEKFKAVFLGFMMLCLPAVTSWAQEPFPTRPIDLVYPFAPGGGADVATSMFKERVGKILGQPLVSGYKPGGGGATATAFVAMAKPDGYTILIGSNTGLITKPLTTRDLGYTMNDLTPICNLTHSPLLWCVKEDGPFKTMQDLIRTAKSRKIKYASYGALSMAHIAMEAVGKAAGFQAIHVPYPGGGPAMAAALGGHVDVSVTSGTGGMVGPGRLRILAVSTDTRFVSYPDVPTMREIGYPMNLDCYYYIWAPKGTPNERIDKIYKAFKQARDDNKEAIEKFLVKSEHGLLLLSPEETLKLAREDHARLKKIIEDMGVLIK